jgi:acyl-[acyl-carrier-protein]-phospholipid O-acyltransferase/long-chain-fatty-acid--[acyl-carrier-protein] ligase
MKNENGKLDHSFAWLNTTQFLGALNDNIFKLLIILFLIGVQDSASATNVSAWANAVFVIPFLLFLAFAGRIADRRSKRDIIIYCKAAELAIMLTAVAAFYTGSQVFLYVVFFCMAVQSTFFSPCKYGIIRELVPDEKVSKANGLLEAATFIAIILGTASAPKFPALVWDNYAAASLVCVFIAVVGLITSVRIGKTEPAGGTSRASLIFLRDVWKTVWSIHRKKNLLWSVIGSAYFWLVGAIIYMAVIPYGMEQLGLSKHNSTYLIIPAAFGIAFGSLAAGRFSSIGLVPIGAVGLGIFCLALGLISPSLTWVCVLIFFMGFSAGMYIVPVNTLIQLKSPKYRRSEIIAASSFLGWLAMLAASGVILLCNNIFKINIRGILILLGVFTLLTAIIITIRLAEFLLRFLSSVLVRLIYHPRFTGAENVPARGGALVICNHVSYADAPLLAAACPRPVRFVMDRGFYELAYLKPICKLARTIPISAKDPPKKIMTSIRQARDALKTGEVVCLFAEGYMTRNGNMLSFKAGFEKIDKGACAPIIPAYIGGMWGSILGYYHGKPFSCLPKRLANLVSVRFGSALPQGTAIEQVKLQVQQLSCDYFNSLKSSKRSLAYRFIRTARKNRRRRCISDASGKKLNYSRTLIASLTLADKLKSITANGDRVGILLPPSVGAALANIAVTLIGKVPVNLNYTSSPQTVDSIIKECDVECVISSKEFLEKFPKLKIISNLVFLEDISRTVSAGDKFKALLKSCFCPASFLAGIKNHNCNDVAAVIFSSGSGGNPKGIMLSHHNIISDIDSMCSIFKFKPSDNLCAVLPFFHSFGFTCSLWLPVIKGVSVSFVPNPLDAKTVGRTARENHSTVLFAAPTFINNYLKRVDAADFANLHFVIAGAEELKTNIADAFEEKFGIRPREGYGATELSPVVSFNVADLVIDDLTQVGTKDGTVGHPIPGIAVKVVDPDTKEAITDGCEGLLMIKGPTVMLGYLNDDEKSRQVIKDGWYNTGDIACIDNDGFIKITGRLARFSKIGGEMVPHVAIENLCHRFFDAEGTTVAVTSLPDPKKGEELIVLYRADVCNADRLYEIISHSDLPNLYKPKKENCFAVDEIPTLGSGKLDLVRIKKIAQTFKNRD